MLFGFYDTRDVDLIRCRWCIRVRTTPFVHRPPGMVAAGLHLLSSFGKRHSKVSSSALHEILPAELSHHYVIDDYSSTRREHRLVTVSHRAYNPRWRISRTRSRMMRLF